MAKIKSTETRDGVTWNTYETEIVMRPDDENDHPETSKS